MPPRRAFFVFLPGGPVFSRQERQRATSRPRPTPALRRVMTHVHRCEAASPPQEVVNLMPFLRWGGPAKQACADLLSVRLLYPQITRGESPFSHQCGGPGAPPQTRYIAQL